MNLTTEQITAMADLEAKAKAGPWLSACWIEPSATMGDPDAAILQGPRRRVYNRMELFERNDAAFIAEASAFIPQAIQSLRAQAAEIERLRGLAFNALAARLKSETMHLSSTRQVLEHPACQEIIAMGAPVLPLIFANYAEHNDFCWAGVLRAIVSDGPVVPRRDCGKVVIIRRLWIEWARGREILSDAKRALEQGNG